MNYQRIKLPYELNGLEPIIYFKTMYYHYEVLHKNYEVKLTETLQGTGIMEQFPTLEKLLENLDKLPTELQEDIRFFGGGVVNHNFFFQHLTKMVKNLEKEISSELLATIEKSKKFNDLESLKKALVSSALKVRGSGWTWLVLDKKHNLIIINTINQDGPWSLGFYPLIAIDVWEHAYFLDYGANRQEYVKKLVNHLLNWEYISQLYLQYTIQN